MEGARSQSTEPVSKSHRSSQSARTPRSSNRPQKRRHRRSRSSSSVENAEFVKNLHKEEEDIDSDPLELKRRLSKEEKSNDELASQVEQYQDMVAELRKQLRQQQQATHDLRKENEVQSKQIASLRFDLTSSRDASALRQREMSDLQRQNVSQLNAAHKSTRRTILSLKEQMKKSSSGSSNGNNGRRREMRVPPATFSREEVVSDQFHPNPGGIESFPDGKNARDSENEDEEHSTEGEAVPPVASPFVRDGFENVNLLGDHEMMYHNAFPTPPGVEDEWPVSGEDVKACMSKETVFDTLYDMGQGQTKTDGNDDLEKKVVCIVCVVM